MKGQMKEGGRVVSGDSWREGRRGKRGGKWREGRAGRAEGLSRDGGEAHGEMEGIMIHALEEGRAGVGGGRVDSS